MMLFWFSSIKGAIGVVSRADIESILLQCCTPNKLRKSGGNAMNGVTISLRKPPMPE
jgi:hypothetical protein